MYCAMSLVMLRSVSPSVSTHARTSPRNGKTQTKTILTAVHVHLLYRHRARQLCVQRARDCTGTCAPAVRRTRTTETTIQPYASKLTHGPLRNKSQADHSRVASSEQVVGVAAWARLAKPEKQARTARCKQASKKKKKAVSCGRASCDRGVTDQRGQDCARQVRCGAHPTGMGLQGGGRQNPIIPGS